MEILQLSEHGISDQALYGKMESGSNGPGQDMTSCPRSACLHTFSLLLYSFLSIEQGFDIFQLLIYDGLLFLHK